MDRGQVMLLMTQMVSQRAQTMLKVCLRAIGRGEEGFSVLREMRVLM